MRPDAHSLLPLHAADALSPEEAADVEEHLAECASCRDDLAEMRESMAGLAEAVAVTPPPSMRDAVLRAAAATPQERSPAVEAQQQEPRRRSRLAVALAACLAVLAIASAASLGVLSGRLDDARNESQLASDVISAPDSRIVRGEVPGGDVVLVASDSVGRVLLVPDALGRAPEGSTWQAWFIGAPGDADTIRSAGLIEDTGSAGLLPSPGGARAVAVSLEPVGGSEQPTTEPVVVVPLT